MARESGVIVFFVCMLDFLSRRKEKKRRKLDRYLYEFNQYNCFQMFQLLWFSIQLFIFHQCYSFFPHDTIWHKTEVILFLQQGK